MFRNNARLALLAIIFLGFLVRVQAVRWNWFMHGDVIDDASVAASFHRDGRLLAFTGPDTADPSLYPAQPATGGIPLKMHGPLLPVIGAAVTLLRGGSSDIADAFLSLRLVSLLLGVLIIWLVSIIVSRLIGKWAGVAAAAWTAASYVLIDYSGNGALYTAQAAIYLLWLLTAISRPSWSRTMLLGIIAGVGYLANYQCMILAPAGILILAFDQRQWSRFLLHAALLLAIAGIIVAPWFIRSSLIFGDPFYHQKWQMRYVYIKTGIQIPEDGVISVGFRDMLGILHSVFTVWIPYNLYYAARKLFIIAPIAFFFFSFGLIEMAFSPERMRKFRPVIILLVLQAILYSAWPVWKFRFFVPLIPFVFILALEQIWLFPPRWRRISASATLAAIIIIAVFTYNVLPTHTTYYDGALTQDAYHSSEELTFLRSWKIFPSP
ncbi:glycosyltransferase family 39 protein [Candidatus Peregrinibacteria bacterium]|nr:glycosyltransferase family 39 protein [Candidatus Peregrinibacteria bacterium]